MKVSSAHNYAFYYRVLFSHSYNPKESNILEHHNNSYPLLVWDKISEIHINSKRYDPKYYMLE